jgi:hypothetical protein
MSAAHCRGAGVSPAFFLLAFGVPSCCVSLLHPLLFPALPAQGLREPRSEPQQSPKPAQLLCFPLQTRQGQGQGHGGSRQAGNTGERGMCQSVRIVCGAVASAWVARPWATEPHSAAQLDRERERGNNGVQHAQAAKEEKRCAWPISVLLPRADPASLPHCCRRWMRRRAAAVGLTSFSVRRCHCTASSSQHCRSHA